MTPKLSSKLAHIFDADIRMRGHGYYLRRLVRIEHGSAQRVEAVVRGSRAYDVEMEWAKGDLSLYCTCPYFDTVGPCKHLWATVLAAESKKYLAKVGSIQNVIQVGLDDLDDESDEELPAPVPAREVPKPKLVEAPKPTVPPMSARWKTQIAKLANSPGEFVPSGNEWPAKREILYVVEMNNSAAQGKTVLSLCVRERKTNGEFGPLKALNLLAARIQSLPLAEDREILAAISGGREYYSFGGASGSHYGQIPVTSLIEHPLAGRLIPMVARTGRCFGRENSMSDHLTPFTWDEGEPWQFELKLSDAGKGKKKVWFVDGVLRREQQIMAVAEPTLVTRGGLVFTNGLLAPLAADVRFDWLMQFRQSGRIEAPAEDIDELVSTLLCTPGMPRVEIPEPLRCEEVTIAPRPYLRIRADDGRYDKTRLAAELSFEYEGRLVPAMEKSSGFFDAAGRRIVRRDEGAEEAALQLLAEVGVKLRAASYYETVPGWDLAAAKLPGVVRTLVEAGWHLDADGKVFRRPGEFRMAVSSGVDWFELHGGVEYGEISAQLPELLEALRRGEKMVKLDDGTYGILPEEWMRRIGMLARMGTPLDGHIRFRPCQAGLLDALLAAQPEAKFDEKFARVRDELRGFKGVDAVEQPQGFVGKLRDYQCEGLGWMDFLRRFSFGGCLADDMGVGKTAQVLAMLEGRRELQVDGKPVGPSLIVVPRSLVFNWKQEAAQFTPKVRVFDYTGLNRVADDFSSYDLILTTYGTLRRDAVRLKDVEFDYLVLDEAQAVKNASTESAKAVRLLRGRYRLALSGTPVENHLGELWSLFEFLNPGMLGAASVFKLTSGASTIDEDTRKLLAHALRPFILRRTKDQVVRELPAKTEQTVYCELAPVQRKLYDELRQHYRDSLLERIKTQGMAKSKIMVLEALLRLRQAACHPGLIDVKRSGETSAKLEAVLEQLREVMDAGHKALVFSQFTSMLKILRARLDSAGVVYEYLDGKTRDRQAPVERFQNDAGCKLFLISLKAGGLGLNLTAAEYVFLLDPWWNPAVEAQAVDRAHRIGQKRAVFAYRLIARDTVEEKVLELQKTKRELAAAIIGEDNALIRNLRREDLELLLS